MNKFKESLRKIYVLTDKEGTPIMFEKNGDWFPKTFLKKEDCSFASLNFKGPDGKSIFHLTEYVYKGNA